jgi:hypothetical protein
LRIEAYFQQIQSITAACSFIQLSNVTYEKRGTYEGFIRGELHFVDDSVLHLYEWGTLLHYEVMIRRLRRLHGLMAAKLSQK